MALPDGRFILNVYRSAASLNGKIEGRGEGTGRISTSNFIQTMDCLTYIVQVYFHVFIFTNFHIIETWV